MAVRVGEEVGVGVGVQGTGVGVRVGVATTVAVDCTVATGSAMPSEQESVVAPMSLPLENSAAAKSARPSVQRTAERIHWLR